MVHGAIGFLDTNKGLWLPEEVLRPLSVREGTKIYGLYYPTPVGYPDDVPKLHDFMLTPVPPNLWPSLTRITIRILQRKHYLEKIADFFKRENMTILFGECTRSGHRYAVYEVIGHFEDKSRSYDDILGELKKNFQEDSSKAEKEIEDLIESTFNEQQKRCEDFVKDMERECASLLFRNPIDPNLRTPILAAPLTALQFFYYTSIRLQSEVDTDTKAFLHRPFSLIVGKGGYLRGVESLFDDIIAESVNSSLGPIAPSYAFVSMDSTNANLRVAFIPEASLKNFARVSIPYDRLSDSKNHSSMGLMHEILCHLPADYNLLHLLNHSSRNEKNRESGEISFFMQDESIPIHSEPVGKEVQAKLQNILPDEIKKSMPYIKIENIDASPKLAMDVMPSLVSRTRPKGPYKYDVFISHSSKNIKDAQTVKKELESHGLFCYMASDEITGGAPWNDEVRSALLDSQEFCLIFSEQSKGSEWVQTEWGAAWALKYRITPIVCQGIPFGQLPQRLQSEQARRFEEVEKYALEVAVRCQRPSW